MRRLALPVTEMLIIAALVGVLVVCWLGYEACGPHDGPPDFASPQFQVIGNRLYQFGELRAIWVPPQGDEPGYWEPTR